MRSAVKLYLIAITQACDEALCGDYYSLEPWQGDDPAASGYDDGGCLYALPDGYRIGTFNGSPAIIDPSGNICELDTHETSAPQLLSPGRAPVLSEAVNG